MHNKRNAPAGALETSRSGREKHRLLWRNIYMHRGLGLLAQLGFLLALIGLAGWGIYIVIPLMYGGYSVLLVMALQSFGCFVVFEILLNWISIKFVDSTYNPTEYEIKQQCLKDDYSNPTSTWNFGFEDINRSSSLAPQSESASAWTMCRMCLVPRPPGCHHCLVCNKCILGRDHHCYFTGSCIGFQNLRHFVVFLTWTSVGTTFATGHMIPYYFIYISMETEFATLNPYLSFKRSLIGQLHIKYFLLTMLGWALIVYTLVSISFFYKYIKLIQGGTISHGQRYFVKLVDRRSIGDKLRAIFGANWALNFLVPLHFLYKPLEDPFEWQSLKFP